MYIFKLSGKNSFFPYYGFISPHASAFIPGLIFVWNWKQNLLKIFVRNFTVKFVLGFILISNFVMNSTLYSAEKISPSERARAVENSERAGSFGSVRSVGNSENLEIPRGREVVEVRNRDDGRGFSRFIGVIETYSREGLQLETADGPKNIAAHSVVRIHYRKSDEHELGDQHFHQKNYRDALAHYKKALPSADRRWLEVEIMAQIVRCETALGFWQQAITDFCTLQELEPEMPDDVFACIPLAWHPLPGEVQTEETALKLLRSRSNVPVSVVLCGSYLLFSPKAKEIPQRLKTFSANRDSRLAQMAESQTWRLELMTVTPEKAASWRDRIEEFPPELRGGPTYVLGDAYFRLKQYDAAALAFLKTALVYGQNPQLSADAMKQAQRALELGGHEEEAKAFTKE